MSNILFKNIINFAILVLSLFSLLFLIFQHRIYVCTKNLETFKNNLEYIANYIDGYPFNAIIKIEMPRDYEYIIYSDGKNTYIHDLSCNLKLKISKKIELLEEVHSKRFLYIIKNNSKIYISPKEIEIAPGIKEDIVFGTSKNTVSNPISNPINIPNIPNPSKDENIYIIFIRSSKKGGNTIDNSEFEMRSREYFEHLVEAYTKTFVDWYPFNDSTKYQYFIIKDKYIDISFEDLSKDNLLLSYFRVFEDVCTKSISNAYATIFVITINSKDVSYGGVAILGYGVKHYNIDNLLRFYSKCNSKILTVVELNAFYAQKSTLSHEVGHAIGNLFDQYLNGCSSYYYINLQNNEIMDYLKQLEKNLGIYCNYLDKNLGASIFPDLSIKIDELYRKYNIPLDKDYVKNEICFGRNLVMLYKHPNVYIMVNITKKTDDYIYDLSKDCNIVLINETKNTIELGDCSSIIKKYNLDLNFYFDQISLIYAIGGICIGNNDIYNIDKDIMGHSGIRKYFSLTSKLAFKNNFEKIWT